MGQLIVITGPAESGKTRLLSALAGSRTVQSYGANIRVYAEMFIDGVWDISHIERLASIAENQDATIVCACQLAIDPKKYNVIRVGK